MASRFESLAWGDLLGIGLTQGREYGAIHLQFSWFLEAKRSRGQRKL